MIEHFFQHADAIARHRSAPMLAERERYLCQLLDKGRKRRAVAECASALCYVVDLLDSAEGKKVTEEVINNAVHRWMGRSNKNKQQLGRTSLSQFRAVARSWSRFLGHYVPRDRELGPFEEIFEEFIKTMWMETGYRPPSVRGLASYIKHFLFWANLHSVTLSSISIADIAIYLNDRRRSNSSARTLAGQCSALRVFFAYAEGRTLVPKGIHLALRTPRFKDISRVPTFPAWRTYRRAISLLNDQTQSEIRAKVVLLLAAVYGLRCIEIAQLKLTDLDWYNEVITIQRAKNGRIQQFPLQYEVGEAIIRYLERVRPACSCNNLIVTLSTPYRRADSIGGAMRKVLLAHGMNDTTCGLHGLRHACATELLRRGTSLIRIADFLGHRNLRSVSIYAQSDHRALCKVANMKLRAVL